jgi:hypothetical protein
VFSLTDRWLHRPYTSPRAHRSIEVVVEEGLRDLARRLEFDYERVQALIQEQLRGEPGVDPAASRDVQFGQLIRTLEARIVQELDLVATRLIGEQAELYSTTDRLRAEAEPRFAIAPPLLALSLFLAVTEHPAWFAVSAAVAVLAWQGVRRRTEANDVLADSLLLERVEAPILERLRRAAGLPRGDTEAGASEKPAPVARTGSQRETLSGPRL